MHYLTLEQTITPSGGDRLDVLWQNPAAYLRDETGDEMCSELLFFCTLNDSVCEANIFTAFGRFSTVTQSRTGRRVRISETKPQTPRGEKKERKTSKKPRQILSKNSLQPTTHFKPSISLCTQSHPVHSILWPPQEGCVLHIIFLFMIPASIVAAVLSRVSRPFPAPLLHLMRLETTK